MSDFWDNLTQNFQGRTANSLDKHLKGDAHEGNQMNGGHFTSVRGLTESGRKSAALELPVKAGTRVSFVTNLGSLLTYEKAPDSNAEGTVVTVRTAEGDTTSHQERVFVKWDNGDFIPIHREHLRLAKRNKKMAHSVRFRVSSLGDLTGFFTVANTGRDDLIHKATKDLWSLQKDSSGYTLSRLFDDGGEPLKV